LKKIVAIYTGQGLAEPLQKLILDKFSGINLVNLIDDSLIRDVITAGTVTKSVSRRLINYYQIAAEMGADLILNTCSSVGEIADMGRELVDIPLVKIDEPMAEHAAANYAQIGVIATLPTTLEPTIRLIKSQAQRLNREVEVVDGLAAGAYQALVSGSPEEHDRLILEVGQKLSQQVDCIVLAQASMMRMQEQLQEYAGVTVLASPPLCLPRIKEILEL